MTTVATSLPNQVPAAKEGKSFRYREAYHLTQLGTHVPPASPTQLTDEKDPTTGFGVRPGGPQGFMVYCSDKDAKDKEGNGTDQKFLDKPSEKAIRRRTIDGAPVPDRPPSINKIMKEHRKSGTPDKISSVSGDGSPNPRNAGSKNNTKAGGKKSAKLRKSDTDRLARKEEKRRRAHGPPILIKTIDDFPEEAHKLVKKTKIPDAQLMANLSVIVHIIRFRTGFNVRTEEEMNKSKEEKTSGITVEEGNSGMSGVENAGNSGRVDTTEGGSKIKDKEDYDSDALDPSIVPKGGEDMLTDSSDIKKMYKNLTQAGRGGFGSVFVAKSTVDKVDIAIKKLPHTSKKMRRTNFNEIGFLTACKHPNIVKYYRSHHVDDEIWVVMEYMQGGTLAEAVERYSFAETSVAYVAREILRALEYLHSHNLVHRDLKSANVMLTVEGKIKLIDFGLCVDYTQRKLCHMAGSPFWMPPEMILGIPHGTPADMWSFAICLIELADGEPPNRKSPVRAMFLGATEGINISSKYSPDFSDFLKKCLQIDQTKRITAGELLKHPFLNKADTQDTMKKILAQIFISNAISNLDYGL